MSTALQIRPLEFIVLQVCPPGGQPQNAGLVVLDPEADRLWVKMREMTGGGEEAEVMEGMEETILSMAQDYGAARAMEFIDTTFDGVLRATDRQQTAAADPEARLRRLYREHVGGAMGTIPVIQLRAAAGGLSEEADVPGEPIDTVEPPPGIRQVAGMFAATVVGRSMEPLIPDGSLCLFRPPGGGSRSGQRLLIEKMGSFDSTSQFTIKEYRSEKRVFEDGTWEHERIRMIPLNPEFEEWNLTPDEFKVVGEFVAVLPGEE